MVLCKTVSLQLPAILLPSITVSLILPKYGLQKLRITSGVEFLYDVLTLVHI